jgi:filamentous hemagglutinin family protein
MNMLGGHPKIIRRRLTAMAGSPLLALALGAPLARGATPAVPSGGSIVSGRVFVASPNETSLAITQSSQKALINWQSFSIGAGANVTFRQPNSAAITLNRVVGTDVSTINGNLFANGQVWLINGNGILFGKETRIDVGGLIATTSDMRDADFLAGKYDFGIPSRNPNAAVVNRGSITAAPGGSVVLSGAQVVNDGVIKANLGKVVLAGADGFWVDFDGDNLIRFAISAPVSETPSDVSGGPARALVSNSGTIAAQGGKILLTARAARSVVNNVINSTGIVEATTAFMQNGEIVFDAGEGGTTNVAGTLKTTGRNAGETGGRIALFGDNVTVASGTNLDASGDAGGGRVLIGGNLHGAGPEPNAQSVNVGEAFIAADAGGHGNGGTVAIYSVGETNVAGSISAKGGAKGGNGGTVETSGHGLRVVESTHVDTSAPAGATGSWLLDPLNINVLTDGRNGLLGGVDALSTNPAGTDVIPPGTIIAALAATNVRLEASNDITVFSAVIYNSANSLTFLAKRNVTFDASVQNGGAGAIVAVAGWDGVTAPDRILTVPGAYGGNGGSVMIGGGNAHGGVALASLKGATTVAAHDLALQALNGYAQIGYDPNANVGGGDGGNTAGSFASIGQGSNGATITVTASGDVTLSGGGSPAAFAQIGNSAGTTGGSVLVTSGGNLTLASGASIRADGSGDALVLAAGGDFINQAGGAALDVSGGGRWLAFLNDPANNSAGGLSASPFYNRAFDFPSGSYAPIAAAGNRFVYALAPTLTITPDNKVRTYGSANPAVAATITGLVGGDTLAGAVSGAPLLGTAATANSAVGDYAIVAALGTLASDFNYSFQFANGTLHIDPATLTYVANAAGRTYGSANPVFSGTLTGFFNGETQATATGGTLAFTSPATPTSKVGSYAINGSGLTANNGNYNFVQAAGNATALTIDPATLTAGLTGSVSKTYDGTDAATLTPNNYALAGAVQGDNVVLNNPTDGRYDDKEAGTGKLVTVSGLALLGGDAGNYALASTQASGAIGVITVPPIDDGILPSTQASGAISVITVPLIDNGILANLISHPVSNTPVAAPAAAGSAIMGAAGVVASDATSATSDATSATTSQISEEPTPATAVANTVGQSLSGAPGSVPSFTSVLIQGLLRQFDPPPGAARPRAVPPVDQIYSSWGNEAFWQ